MRVLRWRGATAGTREHVAITVGANFAVAVLNAATGILLARLLGPTGRGELQAVQIWGILLGTIAALGVPEAVVYFTARKHDDARRVTVSSMALGLLSSVVFFAAGWFVVPHVLAAQNDEVKNLAQEFLIVIPVFGLVWMAAQALRGLSLFGRWNLMRVSQAALWVVVVFGAWATKNFSVAVLAFGFCAALTVQLAINVAVLHRSTEGPYRVEPKRWKPMLRFGIPNVAASFPQLLNYQLDQLLLVAFIPSERLGLYVVGVAWASALAPLLNALGYVLFPRVASEAEEEQRLRIVATGFRLAFVLAAVSVVTLLLLTYPGMKLLYGSRYDDAIPATLILVIAGGVLAVGRVLQEGFRGLGRPTEVLWSELSGLAATGVLLAALLPPLDIFGAALASLGGYSVTLVVLIARLRRAGGPTLHGELVPTGADARELFNSVRHLVRRRPPQPADDASPRVDG